MIVAFDKSHITTCREYARQRMQYAQARGWKDKNQRPSERAHFIGVCGEYAAAVVLGVDYEFTNGTCKTEADVHGIDVRTRTRDNARLIVREDDPSAMAVMLMTVCDRRGKMRFAGWELYGDCKQERWFITGKNGWRDCWMVPQSRLSDDLTHLRAFMRGSGRWTI